ncbi:SRPBCC family protein [Leifsonia poae]|uniref:SRPBCC family protein n=1 Tax=Leifsonia poae TaxID=110933 RepID=UPI001CBEE2D1|nr:SRPBCC domain-containing protein [Leifsonia poae]
MTANYTTTITVDATPQQAFDAINDVSGWWGRITGSTTAIGDEFVYVVPGLHYSGFRVTEIVPAHRISWLVTGSYLDFIADKQEWNGTTVRFDIEEADAGTRIVFTHEGLDPDVECYELCTNAWGMFVNGSLTAFIETGAGEPYSFGGGEALTAADHAELHRQVAEAAGPVNNAD